MNLEDWNSNSPELNRKNSWSRSHERSPEIITKVLGLQWDTIMDKLLVDTKKFDNSMTTATKKGKF